MSRSFSSFLKFHALIVITIMLIFFAVLVLADPFSASWLSSLGIAVFSYLFILVPDGIADTFFLIQWLLYATSAAIMVLPFTILIFWLKHKKSM